MVMYERSEEDTRLFDVEELDYIFGSELMGKGTIVTIMYDAFSLGWALGFEIFKKLLHKNSFGVIHNYTLPVIKLASRAMFVGLDIHEVAKKNKLLIVDVFGSKYNVPSYNGMSFQIPDLTPETLHPKITNIYYEKIFPVVGDRKIVKLVYILDGLTTMVGEDVAIKLLNTEVAWIANMYEKRKIVDIFLLNTDIVSKKFIAWTASLSDIVIVFQSLLEERKEDKIKERMIIIKSPSKEFEPTTFEFNVTVSDEGFHSLNFKK
ncbi:hypothetical protein PF1890 [Pyrococcus furiosus DSM 3638]|uniref:KaiC-like domain-containing protein n=3 Tax=Pyrococcus furiosus TaxID=2261 RepID=Q8TZU3_PYRFU|nr:hypothetical protein [Pyrococcus furiosus]AAL82014.1 hypothetical protein PF1890 [Pyrococcus furiosus DSM 3638]